MKKTLFAAAFALIASANAAAVDDTWYGRVSYGKTDLDFEDAVCNAGACVDLGTDKGFGINVGYRLNRYFAAEGGYSDLGEASISGNGASLSASTSNWSMAAVASTDASQTISFGGKLGFHFWETEIEGFLPELGPFEGSEDGTDIFYGVFANWRDRNWALGVEYTIFQTEIGGEQIDPNMAAVSLSMDF